MASLRTDFKAALVFLKVVTSASSTITTTTTTTTDSKWFSSVSMPTSEGTGVPNGSCSSVPSCKSACEAVQSCAAFKFHPDQSQGWLKAGWVWSGASWHSGTGYGGDSTEI